MQRKLAQAAVLQLRAQLLRNIVCAVACIGLFALSAASQVQSSATQNSSSARASFEVVSIKPDHSGWGGMSADHPPFGPHYSATNVTARALIEMAYDLKDFQLSGAPGWINSHRYDVEANIGASTLAQIHGLSRGEQYDQLRLMMQSLLADRFDLKVTHATKELPVLALILNKNASKLRPFAVEPFSVVTDGNTFISNGRDGQKSVQANRATLPVIATGLSVALQQQVTDQTGLKGNYSFTIRWTDGAQVATGVAPDPAYDRSISAALQELGLKLKLGKGQVDTITIMQIEEPSPN